MGVRRLHEFNVALIGKWYWRLFVDKEGLWYKVLKTRYGAGVFRKEGELRLVGGGCCVGCMKE